MCTVTRSVQSRVVRIVVCRSPFRSVPLFVSSFFPFSVTWSVPLSPRIVYQVALGLCQVYSFIYYSSIPCYYSRINLPLNFLTSLEPVASVAGMIFDHLPWTWKDENWKLWLRNWISRWLCPHWHWQRNREKLLKLKEFKHKWKENNKIGLTVHYWLMIIEAVKITKIY